MANSEFRLTTVDNPYNPFTQFDPWYIFDMQKGYNTCAYLDRIMKTTPDMTDTEINTETERAIDEIIKNDFLNIYRKVKNTPS